MPTRAKIISALHLPSIQSAIPMNTTGQDRLELTFQFAGNSEPPDALWDHTGWTAFTKAQKKAVREALAQVETFLNVDFVEVTNDNDPDINFGRVNMISAWAGQGGVWLKGSEWDGQVVFNKTYDITGYGGMNVILHEIGHALGLDHPFENTTLPSAFDTDHYTVMAYDTDPQSGMPNNSMMIFDLLALQDIWGAASHRTGDTTYKGRGAFDVRVVWDTNGNDTFDASTRDNAVRLDLRPAKFSKFGSYEDVAIAYDVWIENAVGGSKGDRITGNRLANTLAGNGGADTIKGGNRGDRLSGDNGNDTLLGGRGYDKVFGGGDDDVLKGLKGNDRLFGGAGNDTLNGGTDRDRLRGGDGSDTFVFGKSAGRDKVLDFQDDIDTLRFIGRAGPNAVMNHATQEGDDVRFAFAGGTVLVVKNITLDQIADDILVV